MLRVSFCKGRPAESRTCRATDRSIRQGTEGHRTRLARRVLFGSRLRNWGSGVRHACSVLIVLVVLPVAAVLFAGAFGLLDQLGEGGLSIDDQLPSAPAPPPQTPAGRIEREEEIRQLVQARHDRQVARGEQPRRRRGRGRAGCSRSRLEPAPGTSASDAALREEVRQLVVARNERRAARGRAAARRRGRDRAPAAGRRLAARDAAPSRRFAPTLAARLAAPSEASSRSRRSGSTRRRRTTIEGGEQMSESVRTAPGSRRSTATSKRRRSRRRAPAPGRARAATSLASALVLALLVSPFAIGATGRRLREGKRNPSSGSAKRETEIISSNEDLRHAAVEHQERQRRRRHLRLPQQARPRALHPRQQPEHRARVRVRDRRRRGRAHRGQGTPAARPLTTNATGVATGFNADRVDNLDAGGVDFRAAAGTATTDVLNFGGLILRASCAAGPDLDVRADTTVLNSTIHVAWNRDPGNLPFYRQDNDLDPGDNFAIMTAPQRRLGTGHARVQLACAARTSRVTFQSEEGGAFGGTVELPVRRHGAGLGRLEPLERWASRLGGPPRGALRRHSGAQPA